MLLTAVLMPAPEGGFTALNPETGTTSEGETVEEAVVNALVANRHLPGGAMIGRDGHRSPSMPVDRVLTALGRRSGRSIGHDDQGGQP